MTSVSDAMLDFAASRIVGLDLGILRHAGLDAGAAESDGVATGQQCETPKSASANAPLRVVPKLRVMPMRNA